MKKNLCDNLINYYNHSFLTERLNYYLQFAHNTVDHLVSKDLGLPKDSEWYVRHEKIIAETSYFLLYAKAGLKQNSNLEKFNTTLNKVESFARNEKVLLNIALNPALAIDYSFPHICISKLGSEDKIFDKFIQETLDQNYSIERRPYREMEQSWIKSISNFNHQKSNTDWSSKSVLYKKINIFSKGTDMAYALTHAIMYSNFETSEPKIKSNKKLNQTLEALVVKYIEKQDYDVAGELVLSWLLINDHITEIISFAITCLFEIDQVVGFLPAPNMDTKFILGQELEDRKTYMYSINYHTAYVMGMVISVLLSKIVPTKTSSKSTLTLSKDLNISKSITVHQRQWEEIKHKLNISKNELRNWNYIVSILRLIEKHNYSELRKVLLHTEVRTEHEIINQAKDLLKRLSLTAAHKMSISA